MTQATQIIAIVIAHRDCENPGVKNVPDSVAHAISRARIGQCEGQSIDKPQCLARRRQKPDPAIGADGAAIERGCHCLACNAWQIKERLGIGSHGECGASGEAADFSLTPKISTKSVFCATLTASFFEAC
jgi:hypothetical protein